MEATEQRHERVKAYKRAYYARHRERLLPEHRERNRKAREADPERMRALNAESARRRREADPQGERFRSVKRRYGLSRDEMQSMLEAHGGQCAICFGSDSLCVDHHHDSGKVRGLLCNRCNAAIGMLRDNPDLCVSAAAYLQRSLRER